VLARSVILEGKQAGVFEREMGTRSAENSPRAFQGARPILMGSRGCGPCGPSPLAMIPTAAPRRSAGARKEDRPASRAEALGRGGVPWVHGWHGVALASRRLSVQPSRLRHQKPLWARRPQDSRRDGGATSKPAHPGGIRRLESGRAYRRRPASSPCRVRRSRGGSPG